MTATSHITTHVLDAVEGVPAAGIAVQLFEQRGDDWRVVADAVTDADGRVRSLGPERVPSGTYRIRFDTGAYFAARGAATFYPEVLLTFAVADDGSHYHVPLLLSPFAYSTYRGS